MRTIRLALQLRAEKPGPNPFGKTEITAGGNMRIRTLTAIGLVLSALVGHGSNTAYLRGVQSMETTGIPLTVVDTSPDPTAGKVTFTLRNDSDKVVTAWHVRYVETTGARRSGGFGTDAYLSYAERRVPSRTRGGPYYIEPHGTVTATIDSAPTGLQDVTIAPVIAVFADKSFVGDSKEADFIFMRRGAARDAWAVVVTELEAALKAPGNSTAGIQQAQTRLAAVAQSHQNSVVPNTLTNLSLALDDVERGQASAAARIGSLLELARARLAVATAHSR